MTAVTETKSDTPIRTKLLPTISRRTNSVQRLQIFSQAAPKITPLPGARKRTTVSDAVNHAYGRHDSINMPCRPIHGITLPQFAAAERSRNFFSSRLPE